MLSLIEKSLLLARFVAFVRRQATLLAGGATLIAVVCSGAGGVARYLYDRQVSETSLGLRNLAYVATDHANRSLQTVQQSIDKVVDRLQSAHPKDVAMLSQVADRPEFGALLEEIVANNPFIETVFVIGADGRLDRRSRAGAVDPDIIARSGYMDALRQSRPGTFVLSSPFQTEFLRSWQINFSMRVSAPDGQFLGTVAGIAKLSSFSNLFDKIVLGTSGSIAMFRNDGAIISWTPQTEMPFGNNIRETGVYKNFIRPRRDGVAREESNFESGERVYAVANASDYPLATVVSVADSDIAADWRAQARMVAAFAGLASLLIAGVTLAFARRAETAMAERERQILEHQLAQQAKTLAHAFNNVTHGIAMFDQDCRLIVWNRRFADMYGFPEGFLKAGLALGRMKAYNGDHTFGTPIGRTTHRENDITVTRNVMIDERVILQYKKSMPDGSWVASHEDITQQIANERKIEQMATRDALTGLMNRFAFKEHLERTIAEAKRGSAKYAVFYFDLDHFKHVNDTFGHPVGDKFLKEVADRIQRAVRKSDMVARLGGDEFAIIQHIEKAPRDPMKLAERLLGAVSKPYEIEGARITIGASIGIALAPQDTDDSDEAVRLADLALYQSKQKGRNTYNFYSKAMDETVRRRHEMEGDLRAALAQEQFQLYYQPLISFNDRLVQSFEALIRWVHPVRGFVSPAEFIPLAEEFGLIDKIGEWVLRTAALHAAQLPNRIKIAVNVSPLQLRAPGFMDSVRSAIDNAGIAPGRLIVEITEGVMVKDDKLTLDTVQALNQLGIGLAMDDFGTGYSSLSYLRKLPFDKLKVDRSFVMDIGKDPKAEGVVRAIVKLAAEFGMESVAEGIETEEQFDFLAEAGCNYAQGYLFSKPMPGPQTFAYLDGAAMHRKEPAKVTPFPTIPHITTQGDRVTERSPFVKNARV